MLCADDLSGTVYVATSIYVISSIAFHIASLNTGAERFEVEEREYSLLSRPPGPSRLVERIRRSLGLPVWLKPKAVAAEDTISRSSGAQEAPGRCNLSSLDAGLANVLLFCPFRGGFV